MRRLKIQDELLRPKWEGFVNNLQAELRRTGSCQSLDVYWEELLVALWETESKLSAATGHPCPTWHQVTTALWSGFKYTLAHEYHFEYVQ